MAFISFLTKSNWLGFGASHLFSHDAFASLTQTLLTSRKYCKYVHRTDEESMPRMLPRMVYGKSCPWRKQWMGRDHEWKSKLSVFNEKNPSPGMTNTVATVRNLDMDQVKNWWKIRQELQEIENQKYMPERTEILGANLAALHFFTYRHAAVRLKGSDAWIAGDLEMLTETLPHSYEEGYYVEAIDCSNFQFSGLRYEGLENLTGLYYLTWLSLKNQNHIDSWCLDRIAGQNGTSLEYLDISSCMLDIGCVLALMRMPNLQTLIIKDPGDDIEIHNALSLLEYKLPSCLIQVEDENCEPECQETSEV